MKRFKNALVFMITTIVLMSILSINAVAASAIDGLDISLTSDKDEYKIYQQITATLTVTNNNDFPVTNMELQNQIPDKYKLSDQSKSARLSDDSLEPGESISLTVTLDPIYDKASLVVNIILYSLAGAVAIAGGVTALVIFINKTKKKQRTQILSILLCIATMRSIIIPVSAGNLQSKLTIAHTVTANDAELTLNSVITYDDIDGKPENIVIDMHGMLYDEASDTYYATKLVNQLNGVLLNSEDVTGAVCEVSDINNNLLLQKEFTPDSSWTVDDFGMIVGLNNVKFTVNYGNGTIYETSVVINNVCEENMASLNVDRNDDDSDGVLNFTEVMYNTDPQSHDTDGDSLSDYDEMAVLGTDPLVSDTNGNGTADSAEDADGDGISNSDEINTHYTSPVCIDTDGDNLSDFEEISTYNTDPCSADTDKDGKTDYWEIENGYDPLILNEEFAVEEEMAITLENVTVESEYEVVVTELDNDYLINEYTPGFIGNKPVYIDMESGHTADVTMSYDSTRLGEGESPTLYYFNEESQSYEEVPSTIDENGNVTATVDKKGVYVLLNHRYVDDVWTNDIFRPSDAAAGGSIDIVFVIDRSASMSSNDPNGIRKLVTKEFIGKLREDTDRAAVVQFSAIGEMVMPFSTGEGATLDKLSLCNAVDSIQNSSGDTCEDPNAGTNGSAGIRVALNELASSTADHKYIIFLTDGADTSVSEDYGDEAGTYGITGEAKSNGIIIHTVGLIGTGEVDVDLLKMIAAGTGGNYYVATVGEEAEQNSELVEIYDEIESITIDRYIDENEDGIYDYYARLICNGELKTGTGMGNLFGSVPYDEIQKNNDYDNDGILNGDELEIIENENGVFVKVNSYPHLADSDFDSMSDYEETFGTTSPLKKNGNVDIDDVAWLTNSENFISDAYLDLYNESVFERGSVYIGNAFFGDIFDQTTLYKQALAEYFNAIDTELLSTASLNNYKGIAQGYIDTAFGEISQVLIDAGESGNEEEYCKQLGYYHDLVDNLVDGADGALEANDLAAIDDALFELSNLSDSWNLADCQYHMDIVRENMSRVPGIIPAESRQQWIDYLNELSAELYKYGQKAGVHETKLEINTAKYTKYTNFMDNAGKAVDAAGKIMMVTGWAIDSWDAYLDYCELLANLETIENNVYILDCIIASSDNSYLTNAAKSLKFYINDSYSEQTRQLAMTFDAAYPVVTGAAFDLAHEIIGGCMGVPGIIYELVITFGNVVYDLDDASKAAAQTVAYSYAADILSANYLAHLEGGYAFEYSDKWVAYSDYSNDIYTCILNLSELRKCAETQMEQWQSDETVKGNCKSNYEKCAQLIDEYNEKYYLFYMS